jgi:ABC-type polysaccharide/polyol phosphate export permease
MTGALEGFRAAIFGQEFNFAAILFSVAITLGVFVLSLYVFRRMEDNFADII